VLYTRSNPTGAVSTLIMAPASVSPRPQTSLRTPRLGAQ